MNINECACIGINRPSSFSQSVTIFMKTIAQLMLYGQKVSCVTEYAGFNSNMISTAVLPLYRASACNARTVRYCFTKSVCLSVCPMPVLCLDEWTCPNGPVVTLFDGLVETSF